MGLPQGSPRGAFVSPGAWAPPGGRAHPLGSLPGQRAERLDRGHVAALQGWREGRACPPDS
jgi:hypothetical protein